ncbi:MAG: UMP kinase [Acidobacteriota bacterium]
MEELPQYKRIVLKLSGEALKGENQFGISPETIDNITGQIKKIHDLGIDIAIVTGGGNFFRGVRGNNIGISRTSADYMGMLATMINGIALQDALENKNVTTRLISALEIKSIAEPFIQRRIVRHLEKKRVVIFSAGTGSPYFSTDTAAALRAIEIKADILLKATMVDGVFSGDPQKIKDAVKYKKISYSEVLSKELKVLDSTAVSLCKENNLKIKIFNINKDSNIFKSVIDKDIGTLIS